MDFPDPTALFAAQEPRRWTLGEEGPAARQARLLRLKTLLEQRREAFLEALGSDLGKPAAEAHLTEFHTVMEELNHALRHLPRWMRPRRAATPLSMAGTRSFVLPEPKGRVLILAPWNYPCYLLLAPLVAAIAAGNAVILKPSEKASASEAFLAALVRDAFAPEEVALVTGGPEVAAALLELPFDHIFFTGSTRVGKLVMAAAAKHLASVTLELGGKSPALLTAKADLRGAARRLAWAKFVNAGQTCVAPDYVLVPASQVEPFLAALTAEIRALFGDRPLEGRSYARIIDAAAYARQKALLAGTRGRLVIGGGLDEASRGLEPTVLRDVPADDPLLQEEIFGPILPVVAYADREAALTFLRERGDPLASYLFTADRMEAADWIRATRAGGTVVNHAVIHLGNPNLPFGGRGASGLGAYHGVHGFDTFSHLRAIVELRWLDTLAFYFPPYTGRLKAMAFRLLRGLER